MPVVLPTDTWVKRNEKAKVSKYLYVCVCVCVCVCTEPKKLL